MGGLYFVAVAIAMVVSMRHLQALGNHQRQRRAVGVVAMLAFLGLIVVGLILGPWWSPVAAVSIGAVVLAILEEYGLKPTEHPEECGDAEIIALATHRLRRSRQSVRPQADQSSPPPTAA